MPYKTPGDAKEASYDRGVPGKELPFWYFIKHPAEDECKYPLYNFMFDLQFLRKS